MQAVNQTFATVGSDSAALESLAALNVTYSHKSVDEMVEALNTAANSLKEGYELTGSDMSNKK